MTETDTPSWWQRNYRWAIPVAVIGVIILISTCILGFGYALMTLMKSNDAYQDALTRARNSPIVEAHIGSPLQEGLFVTGKIHTNNKSGEATLSFNLEGPKGEGTIHLHAIKRDDRWYFKRLGFQKEGEKTIHSILPSEPSNQSPTTNHTKATSQP